MGYEQQVIDNAAAIQSLIDNAKQVPALDDIINSLSDTDTLMIFSISENKTVEVTVGQLRGSMSSNIIEISGFKFELWKNPNNNNLANLLVLEVNDIIKGFYANGEYFEAQYLGGDSTDFTNFAVYNPFTGLSLQ